jgi:hypothetical protein
MKAVPMVHHIKQRFKANRQFRRRGNRALAEEQRVACVLLEYGHSQPKGSGAVAGEGDEGLSADAVKIFFKKHKE